MLTTDQIEFYNENGYLLIENAIPVEALSAMQHVTNELIEGTVEVTTAVEQFFRGGQFLIELVGERGTNLVDVGLHLRVWFKHVREHRQQLVAEVTNLTTLHIKIEY